MAKKSEVRSVLKASLKKLEEARRMMVDTSDDFTSEEVHAVAIAQFETGKAIEKLEKSR